MDSAKLKHSNRNEDGSKASSSTSEISRSNRTSVPIEVVFQHFRKDAKFDIVFVHGLTRTAEHTWCGQDKSSFWLQKFLPLDVKGSILTCGLNLLESSVSSVPFEELSAQLFDELERLRRERYKLETNQDRSTIFVSHSLGGMLVRHGLMLENRRELRQTTKGLVFFGTPNFELEEGWLKCLALIQKERRLTHRINATLAQDFARINTSFFEYVNSRAEPHQDICCFFETGAAYEIGLIAPEKAVSIPNYPSFPQKAIHMNLARYEYAKDAAYQFFIEQLNKLEAIQEISSTGRPKWQVSLELPSRSWTPDRLREMPQEPDGREIILASKPLPDNHQMVVARQTCLLALAHEDISGLDRAYELYQQAYEMYSSMHGVAESRSLSLFCRDKQGSVKRDQGDYASAEEIGRQVYALQLEGDREHLLRGAGNLARTLRYRGKYLEAFQVIKGALMEFQRCPLHSIAGTTAVSILAKILKDLGRYKFAEHLSRDVVRACYVLLGAEHNFTLNRQSDLAVVIAKRGRYETAVNVSGRALNGLERTLPTDHPLTLRTAKRHATYLRFCGDFERAESILDRTLRVQEDKLGLDHPDVLSTCSSLAAIEVLLGKPENALQKYQHVLKCREERFGKLQSDYKSDGVSKPDSVQPDLEWTREALQRTRDIIAAASNGIHDLTDPDKSFFQTPTLNPNAKVGNGEYDDLEKHPIPRSQLEADLLAMLQDPARCDDPILLGKALRIAASIGDKDAVQRALDKGVDINSTGGYFGNALQAACYFGQLDLVEFLIKNGAKSDQLRVGLFGFALRAAALGNHAKVASFLLGAQGEQDARALADATDEILGTSLEAAMAGFHGSVVQVLLENGANPNAQDPTVGTPLQQASWAGKTELVKMLLEKGANPTLKSGAIDSALKLAASENKPAHREILRLLLKHGAASNGDTYSEALDTAIALKYVENVKILAEFWPYQSFLPPEISAWDEQGFGEPVSDTRPFISQDHQDLSSWQHMGGLSAIKPARRPDLERGARDLPTL